MVSHSLRERSTTGAAVALSAMFAVGVPCAPAAQADESNATRLGTQRHLSCNLEWRLGHHQ